MSPQRADHTVTYSTRRDGAYVATCACGWQTVTLSLGATRTRNDANLRRSVRAHLRAVAS